MIEGEGMVADRGMTDAETAAHLREWAKFTRMPFSWPTDACGYDQHIKFVVHRNQNWHGGSSEEFKKFVLAYADSLDTNATQERG